jgi:PAS domain S-box-containing protein
LSDDRICGEGLALHTYHAVIQQLKQQKHELLSLQHAERRRAKTREHISAAVLSHLPCGVVFFTANGLVRQANNSAKQILGLGALAGMSPTEIFRAATLASPSENSPTTLAEALDTSLRERTSCRQMVAQYVTPGGEERNLEITVSSLHTPEGEVLGAACLINDKTEMERFRRRQELHGEMSAEMALELRNSLATISGYAQQLAASRDEDLARQLASDIAVEAARLDRTIGGFLAGAKAARAAAEA